MPRRVETVTIHPLTAGQGRFGAVLAASPERVIDNCLIWPRNSSESGDPSNIVVTGLNLLLPGGTEVDATDEIEARGHRWTVEGEPGDYQKNGRSKGILVALKRVGA